LKKLLYICCLLFASSLLATEISSPYQLNFFTAPSWIPNSVATNETPGSCCTFAITLHTNHTATAWELAPDSSVTWGLGTDPYYGTFPQWNTDEWSPVDYIFDTDNHDYGSFILDVQGSRDEPGGYDEWTEDLTYYLHGYIIEKETGETAAEDFCLAHFTRDVTTEIVAKTNLVSRRFTEPLQSSFFHTLDGWCEREYFTGLGGDEPDHNLKTTPLQTIATNRLVTTRRFVGKTNLWTVAERLVDISHNSWKAGFSVTDSPYVDNVSPYWSSQVFDDIYGSQIPDDIYWNRYGLEPLTNKCAVLRGLQPGEVWGGDGTNGWLYTEMVPEDFIFGLTNLYEKPVAPGGHDFDFPALCETNLSPEIVNAVTNRSRRFELKTQAAVNQAQAEMDRTILPSGAISAGYGNSLSYTRVREYSTDNMTFEEAGFYSNGDWWGSDSDVYFDFHETTNYWIVTTNGWATDTKNSDAIELSGNTVNPFLSFFVDIGNWSIPASDIVQSLNERHIYGVPGTRYYVSIRDIVNFIPEIRVRLSNTIGCSFDDYYFPSATTNTSLSASVRVSNTYDIKSAGMPDFSSVETMPIDQAWKPGNHGRISTAKDICTAAVFRDDHDLVPEVNFHCAVHTYSRGYPVYNIHTNEWNLHRILMMNQIQSARSYDWSDPRRYVEFNYMTVAGILNSVRILKGYYYFDWGSSWSGMPLWLKVNDAGVWYLEEGSAQSLSLSPVFYGFDTDWDKYAHTIPERLPIEERCRTRITNFIDWNFNAIRKSE